MKVSCMVIEDLMPLYADNVCSPDSRELIEAHLRQCKKCRNLMEGTSSLPLPHMEPNRPDADRAVKKGFQKIRFRWWLSVVILLALIPVAFLGWNEVSGKGVAYSNQSQLLCVKAFVECLEKGDYEKAYGYLDVECKKTVWLAQWFTQETLATMEEDGLRKFCELGEKVEAQGGVDIREYVGAYVCGVTTEGSKMYQVTYRITVAGKPQLLQIDVGKDGIVNIGAEGSFLTEPLAMLAAWAEYLWQDYAGCYFDPELKSYVYYTEK